MVWWKHTENRNHVLIQLANRKTTPIHSWHLPLFSVGFVCPPPSVRMKYYIWVWEKDHVHVCVWECVKTCQTFVSPKYLKKKNPHKNPTLFSSPSVLVTILSSPLPLPRPVFHKNKCLVNVWRRLKSELRWKSFVIKLCLPPSKLQTWHQPLL